LPPSRVERPIAKATSARTDKNVDAKINVAAKTPEMTTRITDEESKARCVINVSRWIAILTQGPKAIAETIEGKWTSVAGVTTLMARGTMAKWGRDRATTCAEENTCQMNTVAVNML
jgi:hypothetical protein